MTASTITSSNLELHRSASAVAAYDKDCVLRPDEEHLIHEFFPAPPASVLDLGVGNGRTTVPLHDRGYSVIGIEYCDELVASARHRNPHVDIRQGDARALPFASEEFDAVWFSWNGIDYMHPFTERVRVLEEARRVLKPGGIFLVSSHNALGVLYRLSRPWGLTRRGLQFLWDQAASGRWMNGWYCVWRDDALQRPMFYSAPPSTQVRMLRGLGWEVLDTYSVERSPAPASWWRDVHVNYVCRKPAVG